MTESGRQREGVGERERESKTVRQIVWKGEIEKERE